MSSAEKIPRGAKTAKPVVKEKVIENSILSFLAWKRVFAFKVESVGVFDPVRKVYRMKHSIHRIKGVSDILGCLPDGRFLAIEVKSAVGRLSDDQKRFLELVNSNGGLGFVARSVEEVSERLGIK